MTEKDEPKKLLPPYLPYKSLVNFLDTLKAGAPQRIDRSLMKSTSGGLQAQIISALGYLKLIDPQTGVSAEKLGQLVKAQGTEKKQTLKEILTASYTFLFEEGFDLDRATSHEIQERFQNAGVSGDTVRKAVTFFLKAAKDADLPMSPYVKISKTRAASTRAKRKTNVVRESPTDSAQQINGEDTGTQENIANSALLGKLFDKLPSLPDFDPNWTPEAQTAWLNTYTTLLNEFKKPPKE